MANLVEQALLKKGRALTLMKSRQSIQMWYDKHRLLMRDGQPIEFIRRDNTKETFAPVSLKPNKS